MKDIYNISAIINHAISGGYDIAPDRMEWVKLCHALKLMGYDETYFVALSQCHGTPESVARRKWREEKSYHRFLTEATAPGLIVNLAKSAGIEVNRFYLNDRPAEPRRTYRAAPTPPMKRTPPAEPKPEAVYIAPQQVRAAQAHAHETSLYIWLCKEFDPAEVDKVLAAYKFGGAKYINPQGGRASVFPYINTAGDCVDCKIFHIDPESGSRKTAPPLQSWTDANGEPQTLKSSWALFELRDTEGKRMNDRRGVWCNFGDHLLSSRPLAPVGIVESEKTALILSLAYPGVIWIAVGSKQNLNAQRFAPYRGREVTIYPDRDGYNDKPRKDGKGIEKGWRSIARELAAEGFNLSIDTTTERHPGEPNDDLADILLRFRHGEQLPPPEDVTKRDTPEISPEQAEAVRVFEQMKANNPMLAELAEKLQLEPVRIEHHEPDAVQSLTTAQNDDE